MLAVNESRAPQPALPPAGPRQQPARARRGRPDIVLHTRLMAGIWHEGVRPDCVRVEAGARASRAWSRSVTAGPRRRGGVLAGVPGTLGGAVAGNAGTRHGAIGDVLREVTVLDEAGAPRAVACSPADFGYRRSPFRGAVLDAVLQLRAETPAAIGERLAAILRAKREPAARGRSAGCMFRNTPDAPVRPAHRGGRLQGSRHRRRARLDAARELHRQRGRRPRGRRARAGRPGARRVRARRPGAAARGRDLGRRGHPPELRTARAGPPAGLGTGPAPRPPKASGRGLPSPMKDFRICLIGTSSRNI